MPYAKKENQKIAIFEAWIAKRDTSIRSQISGGSPLRFKKLFGTEFNKELLIDFLNQVLGERERIQDLTYLNTENLGNTATDRKAIFDLYCENENGEKFIIELQNVKQQYFKDRSIFYSTFPIQSQAPKGREWDYYLKAVYTVGILNFSFPDQSQQERYMREVQLIDKETQEVFYDKLTFIYLEMPKFRKGEDELESHFDKCRRGAGCMY